CSDPVCTCLLATMYYKLISHAPKSTLFPYTTLFRSITITVNPTASSGLTSDYGPFNSNCTDVEVNFQVDAATLALPFPKTYEWRSEEHTSELQSRENLVCRLLLEKKN